MFAGKDHVAQQAGLVVKGFADPIYQLCEHLTGTRDKSVPGIRRCMQQIGQWGNGHISEEYPLSMERALLTHRIQQEGPHMTKDFDWVKWSEYGTRRDFWVNILLTRLGDNTVSWHPGRLNGELKKQFGITNARFSHELEPCLKAGFQHFHVRCSPKTRELRMREAGYVGTVTEDQDISEQMAIKLDREMPDSQVIWNDEEPFPDGQTFLRVQDFVDMVKSQQIFPLARPGLDLLPELDLKPSRQLALF
jgi:hypothetical protein